jgi:hypothetical protein
VDAEKETLVGEGEIWLILSIIFSLLLISSWGRFISHLEIQVHRTTCSCLLFWWIHRRLHLISGERNGTLSYSSDLLIFPSELLK